MTIWEWLDKIDKSIFRAVHSEGAVPALDGFISLLRHEYTWIPVYAFILIWLIIYHRRHAWQFVLLTVVCVGITDYVSAQFLKPAFGRLRPCHDTELTAIIRHIINCGGRYSLPSNHAANHFGLATFWFFAIRTMTNRKWYWLFVWAFLIGYAQVYVGKHYPFDILAGALFGFITAFILAIIFRRWLFKKANETLTGKS
jgi:membrane-associated phospholipid phosphatase